MGCYKSFVSYSYNQSLAYCYIRIILAVSRHTRAISAGARGHQSGPRNRDTHQAARRPTASTAVVLCRAAPAGFSHSAHSSCNMLLRAVVPRARGAGLRAARPVAVSNASRQFSLALTQKPQQPALGRFARLLSVEDVPVPSMGDSITEGTVVEWTAQVGDGVAVDDVVVVIETDKVSVVCFLPQAFISNCARRRSLGEHRRPS